MVTLGMVVGLDYRDAELSVHDLLQELKTHPLVRRILEGGERVEWGRRRFPKAASSRCRSSCTRPACCSAVTAPASSTSPALKGIHYAVESGRLAAEAAFARCAAARARPTALAAYDDAVRDSFIWKDLQEVRNMRQAFGRGFWLGGALASAMTATKGHFPPGQRRHGARRASRSLISDRPCTPLSRARREADVRQAVVRLRVGEQDAARQPTQFPFRPNSPPRPGGWENMCPAHGYKWGENAVQVTPSNCVQCGAITAKGGRLTPPEGGSGPEYKLS